MAAGRRESGETVGDYRLLRKVLEDRMMRSWEAEQLSMQRPVMLEILQVEAARNEEVVRAFLANVRAKALVSHPGVGSVYEAVASPEAVFFSRERLEGETFAALAENGRKFTPLDVVKLLRQIAVAMRYLEEGGIATADLSREHFILGSGGQVRVMNLAVEGARDEAVETRCKVLIGEFFAEVLSPGHPGETRVRSLCGFMTDPARPTPLDWEQIETLCEQVRIQLESPAPLPVSPPPPSAKKPLRPPPSFWALVAGVALIVGVIFLMVAFRKPKTLPDSATEVRSPGEVTIREGNHVIAGGSEVRIRAPFTVARGEVTLAEYQAFLEDPKHRNFAHPDQPTSKKNHLPADWDALWRAAVKGQTREGRAMSLECPVVGVDWWDAYTYARWKGGDLPDLSEWMAAASMDGVPAGTSSWGEIGIDTEDLTGAGVAGMAGNVREWTRRPEINPANPLAPRSYVAAGASFEEPTGGIETRLWLPSREIRRPDLGFRIIVKN